MRKSCFCFLARFFLITIVYTLENVCMFPFYLSLDPRFFSFVLLIYLISIISTFFFDEEIMLKNKLISDIIFISLFLINTIILLAFDMGDVEAKILYIILYLPLLICYIVWFNRDKKQLEELTGRKIFRIRDSSNKILFLRFLIRFSSLTIIYAILNHFFSFTFLLSPLIFWTIIVTYFLILFLTLFFEKKIVIKLLVILDIFFICIFCLQSVCMIISSYMILSNDNPCFYEILTISPMIICFSVFLVRDIKYMERDNE